MNKLDLLKLAEQQDVEAFEPQDFEEAEQQKSTAHNFKQKYQDFYDDIKQKSNYIKEDW